MSKHRCAVCGDDFDPRQSLGRLECRTHVVRERQGSSYACCGLSHTDERAAHDTFYLYLSRRDCLGCLSADHVAETRDQPVADARRAVDDVHIVFDITNSRLAVPRTLTAADLTYDEVRTAGAFGMNVLVFDTVDKKVKLEEIRRNIEDEVRAAVYHAYGTDAIYANNPANGKERDNVLKKVASIGPGESRSAIAPEAATLIARRATMSDQAFLQQWFTQIEPDKIKVFIRIVRATAVEQDASFFTRLAQQRQHMDDLKAAMERRQ